MWSIFTVGVATFVWLYIQLCDLFIVNVEVFLPLLSLHLFIHYIIFTFVFIIYILCFSVPIFLVLLPNTPERLKHISQHFDLILIIFLLYNSFKCCFGSFCHLRGHCFMSLFYISLNIAFCIIPFLT